MFGLDEDYDGDFSDIDASGKTVPYTDEEIVIYYTSNYQELQPLNGLTVTLDVVLYGLRDDRNIFNAVFLGTIDDVLVPDITDGQTVNAVKQSLETSTPTVISEATTINLPTELLDADIAWSSTHQDIIALDGTVTPINDRVEVTLTAVITKGDETATATIKVIVGELPITPIEVNSNSFILANANPVNVQLWVWSIQITYKAN